MLITLICVIICAVIAIKVIDDVFFDFLGIFLGIICGLFIGLGIMFFAQALNYNNKVVKEEIIPIYSLDTTTTTHGAFTLGMGSVDSVVKYYYYVKDSEDYYTLNSISASYTKIKLDDTEEPKIIKTYDDIYKQEWFNIIFTWGNILKDVKIILPTNSIKKEFNANVK